MLIYPAGLQLSELLNLRKDDVLYGTRQLFIKSGKGKKDRYSILSEKIVTLLSQYLKQYQPSYWLFEGMNNEQYSARSVQAVFRKAVAVAGVTPYATVHTFTLLTRICSNRAWIYDIFNTCPAINLLKQPRFILLLPKKAAANCAAL